MPCQPALVCAGAAMLASLASSQQLLQNVFGTVPRGELGRLVRAVGDADGDGVGDFVVTQPETQVASGHVFLVSGATRATLATFVGAAVGSNRGLGYYEVSPIGDVDGDSRTDFAAGYGGMGPLDVFSGATGARLYRLGSSPPDYYFYACAIGDQDGDTHDDFAAVVYFNTNTHLWLLRGVNGTQLGLLASDVGSVIGLRNIGNVAGNGRDEIAVLKETEIRVYGLDPPVLLWASLRPAVAGFLRHMEAADLTGDGVVELLVADDQRVFVFAAATGALLRTLTVPGGAQISGHFAVVGDLDADGVPDLAFPTAAPLLGSAVFASGRDGHRLAVWPGSYQFAINDALSVAGPGDLDGDGFGDLVLGYYAGGQTSAGAWQVVSGRILAGMESLPVNCGGGPFLPELGITRPVLGQGLTIVGRDCPPAAPGIVALSARPAVPVNLGAAGCDAWFDLANWTILHQPPAGATWTLAVPLPGAPQLAGLEVALQAFYLPTNGPLGFDLSNGIWARLGY